MIGSPQLRYAASEVDPMNLQTDHVVQGRENEVLDLGNLDA